jgi:hypothetical protein
LEETDATTTADGHAEINFRKIDGIWKFRPFIYIESLPGK